VASGPATHCPYPASAHSCVPSAFFLQPHVFLCRAKRYWVILDVNRDKYLCVDRRQFESLGPWIRGWEETTPLGVEMSQGVAKAAEPPAEAIALASKLLSLEVLSERADGAKDAQATAYSHPTGAVDLDIPASAGRSSYTHALGFFLSSARASRQLRDQRFESIVAAVKARKRRNWDSAAAFDIERARSLTSVFDSLRLFYPRPYLCLFDSLALINFLARFGLYPDWVFGVQADPFEAHCWVQTGSVVLNDTVERVSAFTPIMYI
jgi:Transglutaminase-like superfamily